MKGELMEAKEILNLLCTNVETLGKVAISNNALLQDTIKQTRAVRSKLTGVIFVTGIALVYQGLRIRKISKDLEELKAQR